MRLRSARAAPAGLLDAIWRAVLVCLMVEAFFAFLGKNWATLAGAPLVFILTLVTATGVAFVLIRWRYESIVKQRDSSLEHKDGVIAQKDAVIAQKEATLATVGERLKHRDDQIADLRGKVGTDSPTEIKARIDLLETQLAALQPRRLSDAQRTKMASTLQASRGTVMVMTDMSAGDAGDLADDIRSVFGAAGWTASEAVGTMFGVRAPAGIGVGLRAPTAPTPIQSTVIRAVSDAVGGATVFPDNSVDPSVNALIYVTRRSK